MLCLQAVMSSARITNAWCVIAQFNEFEITLNYPALPQRKHAPRSATGFGQTKNMQQHRSLLPERNNQQGKANIHNQLHSSSFDTKKILDTQQRHQTTDCWNFLLFIN